MGPHRRFERGVAMAKRQQELAGMERDSIPEINAAAEAYVKARDKRMKLTEEEVDAHDDLVEAMKRHKVRVYKDTEADPPLIMTRTSTEVVGKVKVSIAAKARKEADGDAEKKA